MTHKEYVYTTAGFLQDSDLYRAWKARRISVHFLVKPPFLAINKITPLANGWYNIHYGANGALQTKGNRQLLITDHR